MSHIWLVPDIVIDPLLRIPVTVRVIQPYQAQKTYQCPDCRHSINAGVGHIVAVPIDEPDLRRHWHKGCWTRALARKPRRG